MRRKGIRCDDSAQLGYAWLCQARHQHFPAQQERGKKKEDSERSRPDTTLILVSRVQFAV